MDRNMIDAASGGVISQAKLIRVNKGVSAEMKLSRSDRLHLGRTRVVPAVHALQPSSPVERPNCIDHISYPARRPSAQLP
ncbi:hypothetical protein CR513_20430, partial [Mucuna pruriens]